MNLDKYPDSCILFEQALLTLRTCRSIWLDKTQKDVVTHTAEGYIWQLGHCCGPTWVLIGKQLEEISNERETSTFDQECTAKSNDHKT